MVVKQLEKKYQVKMLNEHPDDVCVLFNSIKKVTKI